MAKIVLGLASSHSPQLNIPASQWPLLQKKDESDPRIDYQGLLRKAPSDIAKDLTPEVMQQRDETCQNAVKSLAAVLKQSSPDVLVVFGDDQHEQYFEDNLPMFSVFRGDTLPMGQRNGLGGTDPGLKSMATDWRAAEHHVLAATETEHPAAPALGNHLIERLIVDGFDVACSNQLKEDVGLGHAFSFVHRRLLPDGTIPMVPIMVNCFYPPNQPTARRCYGLGQAVRRAVENWDSDARVAIIASGGLSHVIMDEELDRGLLDAMLEKDVATLCAQPAERMTLGTSENRNWIAMAGAMEPMDMLLAQYIPCYRSPAGTGCGMAFAYWM